MKIQVINHSIEKQDGNVQYSKIQSPRSLDEYDIVVIDLTDKEIWVNNSNRLDTINCIRDFVSIQQMIVNRRTSKIVIALPQNIDFKYDRHYDYDRYVYSQRKMKDNLVYLQSSILPHILPVSLLSQIIYENTETRVGEIDYQAAFFFLTDLETLTVSNKSNKATTISLVEGVYITTLNISESTEKLNNYLRQIFESHQKQEAPEWMKQIAFYDDVDQQEIIKTSEDIIKQEKDKIEKANCRLSENKAYKSILYTNGSELMEIVTGMLEAMLEYDLSDFVDEKREDFLIKKDSYTLIGEIKGITSNVKNDNVSQLDNHYQQYMDKLEESGIKENVHQVLIINPLRNKPLNEREPVHDNQINLAVRNNSLIIETKTLLRMFELFLQNRMTTEKIERILTTNVGLLTEKDLV